MVSDVTQRLMECKVENLCDAGFNQRSDERSNHRNGYWPRRWETRAGAVDLKVSKLPKGSYIPASLEPRKTSQKAFSITETRSTKATRWGP